MCCFFLLFQLTRVKRQSDASNLEPIVPEPDAHAVEPVVEPSDNTEIDDETRGNGKNPNKKPKPPKGSDHSKVPPTPKPQSEHATKPPPPQPHKVKFTTTTPAPTPPPLHPPPPVKPHKPSSHHSKPKPVDPEPSDYPFEQPQPEPQPEFNSGFNSGFQDQPAADFAYRHHHETNSRSRYKKINFIKTNERFYVLFSICIDSIIGMLIDLLFHLQWRYTSGSCIRTTKLSS